MMKTNELLEKVTANIETMIGWADADREQSLDDGADDQAVSDDGRARKLRRVLALLQECER